MQLEQMSPSQVVSYLDRYIIGQDRAKKQMAIALRNRVRRRALPSEVAEEIMPKNVILIGSTGVGKTEIARRISKLAGAPFLKVEATKFTEVGYVGRDVESMIRDLLKRAIALCRKEMEKKAKEQAEGLAEDELVQALLAEQGAREADQEQPIDQEIPESALMLAEDETGPEAQSVLERLRAGELEDENVMISVEQGPSSGPIVEVFGSGGMEEMGMNLGGTGLGQVFGPQHHDKRMSVRKAREILIRQHLDDLIDEEALIDEARQRTTEMGIVFIDEIDKVLQPSSSQGGIDVSREGVQRDLLPIVEGSQVSTKYGFIDTTHILFIAAGAFTSSSPSDLIPELQGRFPLRVELEELSQDDFEQILTRPEFSMTEQYAALLSVDNLKLSFSPQALREIARYAMRINQSSQNIGARRLHTLLETLLEDVLFAPERYSPSLEITSEHVKEKLEPLVESENLAKFIL